MAAPTSKYDALAGEIDRLRTELHIPGLSVAIAENQEIEFATGFGLADLEREVPASADTPYHIASLTKPFAATVIMKLVEQGRLDLDTPVADILEDAEFPLPPRGRMIHGYRDACRRLRELSEEPDLPFAAMMRGYNGDRETITVRHHITHTSEGKPGSVYHYNGFLFGFLTKIIETVSNRELRELLVDWITGPLDMASTVPNLDPDAEEVTLSQRARYYRWTKEHSFTPSVWPPPTWGKTVKTAGLEVTQRIGASSGMISTVLDLAKFDAAMDKDAVVSEQTKAAMYTPARSNSGTRFPYGLGWFIQDVDGQEVIWHYGLEGDTYSSLWLKVPAENTTMILLANSDSASRGFGLGVGDVLQSPFARLFISWVMYEGNVPD